MTVYALPEQLAGAASAGAAKANAAIRLRVAAVICKNRFIVFHLLAFLSYIIPCVVCGYPMNKHETNRRFRAVFGPYIQYRWKLWKMKENMKSFILQ
jgi:hypothetical protein